MRDRRVATAVGVSRRTIARWRVAERPPGKTRRRARQAGLWRPEPARQYAYLLGMYLGDGHIAGARHPFLRLSLDRAYPGLIAEARTALEALFPPSATQIHSDGCRTINRFETKLPSGRVAAYAYPRYFFTNLSADIRGIFCRHCDLLGIRWSQSNARNISVSHRVSVALLDSFIGPKR